MAELMRVIPPLDITLESTMRIIAILLTAIFLAGCASTGMSSKGEKAYYEAQEAASSQPIMSMECPDGGCQFKSLKVHQPDASVQPLAVRSPGVELGKAILSTAATLGPWAAITQIGVEGMQAAQGDSETTTETVETTETTETTKTTTETTETVETTERGDTYGDGATTVGGDQTGDYSGDSSGNSGRIDSPSTNSTSDPTVVEQPEPTVVEQPEPVVTE